MRFKQYTVLFLSCATLMASHFSLASSAEQYATAMQKWASVLTNHVDNEGRIDFKSIAEDSEELNSIVRVIETYGPNSHPEDFQDSDKVMAYHINAYNALAMYGVIERGIPEGFTTVFKRMSFFRLRDVLIDGETTNLSHYENRVIRPLAEPRAHFTLNCMVKDCPRLPQVPYTAENLNEELQNASLEFFSKPRHFRIDHQNKAVHISSILKFYTEDFVESGRKQDLPKYINQFLSAPIPADYKLVYIDYDWRINSQPE